MKTNVDITFLTAEWDDAETDFDAAFGITKGQRFSFLAEVRRRLLKQDRAVADVFMDMVREGNVPGGLLLALAAFGAQETWEENGTGVMLALDAAEEEGS